MSSTACFLLPIALTAIYTIAPVMAKDHFPSFLFSRTASQGDWDTLNASTGGRLFTGVPFSQPCFIQPFNSSACLAVRGGYLDEGNCCFTFTYARVVVYTIIWQFHARMHQEHTCKHNGRLVKLRMNNVCSTTLTQPTSLPPSLQSNVNREVCQATL
jgi:hypothetical protein